MKVSDFKLLADNLNDEYDYEIFPYVNGALMIIGKKHRTIIGYLLGEDGLSLLKFTHERTQDERINDKK